MSRQIRLINGKGDWTATPPTGATDADLYQLANDFVVQAGVVDLDGGDALVTEPDTPGLSVKVAAGTIYVLNSTWSVNTNEPKFYQIVADADEDIAISSNSSGDDRIDLICQSVDKVTNPNDNADNVCPIEVVEGTPGAGEPAVPADHELLAVVTVSDGATGILNADIEDRRRQVYLQTRDINEDFVDLVDGVTITVDLSQRKRKFRVTLGGNRTIAVTNAKEGDTFYLRLTNDGTARTPVWFSNITWFGIENNPNFADYVNANKSGGFVFICTGAGPTFDGYFLGAQE